MVGSTEISIFEVRRSSTTVCCTLDMLSKSMYVFPDSLSESRKSTCDT